jgi:UDP-glucose 4-epimerase
MTDRRAVVTGAAGFIGSRLVGQLVDLGWRVWGLDDLSVGRREDVSAAVATARFDLVEADVADGDAAAALIASARPQVVFHLAARHFIPECERDPAGALRANVLGTQAVIAAASRGEPPCRVVFASSGAVYAPSLEPHDEQAPVAPDTIYAISKATGEQLLAHAGRAGLEYRIARLFNVFGPGDRTRHVVPDIVDGVISGTLALGALDPVRDYIYVDDVVRALLLLGEHDGPERVFNVGTGLGRSVQSLVDAVLAAHKGRVLVRADSAKARRVERQSLISDSRRAASVLGWTPRVGCNEGLQQTLAARRASMQVRTW